MLFASSKKGINNVCLTDNKINTDCLRCRFIYLCLFQNLFSNKILYVVHQIVEFKCFKRKGNSDKTAINKILC